MFMMDIVLRSIKGKSVSVLHFQHGIREDDDNEVKLVRELANTCGVDFVLGKGESLRDIRNQEAEARTQRWTFVEEYIQKLKGTVIVLTAHHYDDQIESFLMSSIRGRSVNSLVMKRLGIFDGYTKYKPLLNISKEEIYNQAKRRSLRWVEDPTNQDINHERNIFRNKIIPELMNIRNIRTSMRSLISEISQ